MTESELRSDVKSPSGCYFFYGDEDYMKNHYAAEIRKAVVDPSLASFNYVSFTDEDFDIAAITDAMLAPPMMAEQKLIDVSLANFAKTVPDKERARLLSAVAEHADPEYVVFVMRIAAGGFDPGTPKKPSAFLRDAEKQMKTVRFDFQSDALLMRWLERHFAEYGLTISRDAETALLDACGRSMYRLSNELAKAAAYAAEAGKTNVERSDIEASVAKTDEDDAFRMANCILSGDIHSALMTLAVKKRMREDPILLLAQITRVFIDLASAAHAVEEGMNAAEFARAAKMHSYRAGLYVNAAKTRPVSYFDEAVMRCAEADRLLKSTSLGYETIERLIGLS